MLSPVITLQAAVNREILQSTKHIVLLCKVMSCTHRERTRDVTINTSLNAYETKYGDTPRCSAAHGQKYGKRQLHKYNLYNINIVEKVLDHL